MISIYVFVFLLSVHTMSIAMSRKAPVCEAPTCEVCYDGFNKSTRKKIVCGLCDNKFCRACLKQNILFNDGAACCPSCRVAFDDTFLTENLPKAFLKKDYRNHLAKEILGVEKGKLPECMPFIKDYKEMVNCENTKKNLNKWLKRTIHEDCVRIIFPLIREYVMYCNENMHVFCDDCQFTYNDYFIIQRRILGATQLSREDILSPEFIELLPEMLSKKSFVNYHSKCNNCCHYLRIRWNKDVTDSKSAERKLVKKYNLVKRKFKEIKRFHSECNKDYSDLVGDIPKVSVAPFPNNMNVKKMMFWLNCELHKRRRRIFLNTSDKKPSSTQTFKHACPKSDCKGFLSQNWTCAVCEDEVCKHCFVVMQKDAKEHVCKESDVETVKFIKSSTKPCPNCGTGISKINGCDQMWCTICKVAFSWKRGTIEREVIHNPHYYQWMKSQKNSIRAPNDVVCGGLVRFRAFNNKVREINALMSPYSSSVITVTVRDDLDILASAKFVKMIENIHRTCAEFVGTLRRLRLEMTNIDRYDEDKKFKMRLDYLANNLTEKMYKNKLFLLEKKKKSKMSHLHLLELTTTVFIENINGIYGDEELDDIIQKVNTMEEFRLYYNSVIMQNAHKYNEPTRLTIGDNMSVQWGKDGNKLYHKVPTKKMYEESKKYMDSIRTFGHISDVEDKVESVGVFGSMLAVLMN